jgi:hypothetical protein
MLKRTKELVLAASTYIAILPNQVKAAGTTPTYGGLSGGNDLMQYVNIAINTFIGIAGVLSVIFIIIGGFQYITAGTSKDGATKAKQTLTYAIIGLVIVALAVVIRNFVIARLGVNAPAESLVNP